MANIEDYFYKFDLMALPQDISNYNIFALTSYELKMLSQFDFFSSVYENIV